MTMNKNIKIFLIVIIILILGTIATVLLQSPGTPPGPGKYDVFTQCLKDKGAVFYGAFWCPHCQAEKKLFGSSVKLLPYVECSTADASGQTQICIDKKIESYPTWEFADGSRLNGEIPLQQLADKTSCVLPQ
jgi:thiol-disulfide isomerase/thioredoxin